jgi:hypothetical protein
MNPLKHFLDSCLLYWKEIIYFVCSFVFGVGGIVWLANWFFKFLNLELMIWFRMWRNFRLKK